jgi:hypothetical protein
MDQGANAARTLRKQMRISRVPALEDDLQTPEERPAAPGVFHLAIFNFYLYAQVTLYSRDGVNDDSCHCFAPFSKSI